MKSKSSVIILLVVIIGSLHFIPHKERLYYHIFYGELFFLPIILAGFWFGLLGALSTSMAVTAFSFPFVLLQWSSFSPADFDRIIEIMLYNGVALIVGLLKNREISYVKRLLKAESLAAMGQSLASVAHDMKTPLIAIGGFSKQLRKRFGESDHDLEKLEIVIREAERLENMMQNMLDFSRPLDLHLAYRNPNEILEFSLNVVSHAAQEKTIHIERSLAAELPLIPLDAGRMVQALINLLTNAIHASPETETIEVHTSFDRDRVFIDIADRGSGISAEQKVEIFLPFISGKDGGTGLGLPIALKIVQAHGGSLDVRDNAGHGVVFRITMHRESGQRNASPTRGSLRNKTRTQK